MTTGPAHYKGPQGVLRFKQMEIYRGFKGCLPGIDLWSHDRMDLDIMARNLLNDFKTINR